MLAIPEPLTHRSFTSWDFEDERWSSLASQFPHDVSADALSMWATFLIGDKLGGVATILGSIARILCYDNYLQLWVMKRNWLMKSWLVTLELQIEN